MDNEYLYYFLLGFAIMAFLAIMLLAAYPEPETQATCLTCGSKEWWFAIVEGE